MNAETLTDLPATIAETDATSLRTFRLATVTERMNAPTTSQATTQVASDAEITN